MPAAMVLGTPLKCSMGNVPMPFRPMPPVGRRMVMGLPVGQITDIAPFVSIGPFGMCMSMANPTVAAATAAAQGVLTPMPCTPTPAGPWAPPEVDHGQAVIPNISQTACLFCAWGGTIQAVAPVQLNSQLTV